MVAGSTNAAYRTYGVPGEPPGVTVPGVAVPGVVGMLPVAPPGVLAGGTVVSPGVIGVSPGVIGPVGPGLPGGTGVGLRGVADGGGVTGGVVGVGTAVLPLRMSSGPGESAACFTGLCACEAEPAPEPAALPIALPEPTPASPCTVPCAAGAASADSTPARNE